MNVFYVTSFITEKTSERIIEEEKIEDYIIISDVRYKSSNKKSTSLDKIYDLKKPIKNNLIKNWKEIYTGNRKIKKTFEDGFYLYIPNANIESVRIMMSHKKCRGFYFLEEGFTSYCKLEETKRKKQGIVRNMKENIKYMGYTVEGEIFKRGYEKVYGLSDYSFPGWRRREVLEPNFSKDTGFAAEEDSCILVLDSMRALSSVKEKLYISSLSDTIKNLEKEYKKIYYKMHPDNYKNKNNKIFKSVVESCNRCTKEIDQSRSIEELALGSRLDVVVNLSSAGLYCLLYSNSDVYTFYNIFRRHAKRAGLEDQDILGFERFVPDVFWDNVIPMRGDKTELPHTE